MKKFGLFILLNFLIQASAWAQASDNLLFKCHAEDGFSLYTINLWLSSKCEESNTLCIGSKIYVEGEIFSHDQFVNSNFSISTLEVIATDKNKTVKGHLEFGAERRGAIEFKVEKVLKAKGIVYSGKFKIKYDHRSKWAQASGQTIKCVEL